MSGTRGQPLRDPSGQYHRIGTPPDAELLYDQQTDVAPVVTEASEANADAGSDPNAPRSDSPRPDSPRYYRYDRPGSPNNKKSNPIPVLIKRPQQINTQLNPRGRGPAVPVAAPQQPILAQQDQSAVGTLRPLRSSRSQDELSGIRHQRHRSMPGNARGAIDAFRERHNITANQNSPSPSPMHSPANKGGQQKKLPTPHQRTRQLERVPTYLGNKLLYAPTDANNDTKPHASISSSSSNNLSSFPSRDNSSLGRIPSSSSDLINFPSGEDLFPERVPSSSNNDLKKNMGGGSTYNRPPNTPPTYTPITVEHTDETDLDLVRVHIGPSVAPLLQQAKKNTQDSHINDCYTGGANKANNQNAVEDEHKITVKQNLLGYGLRACDAYFMTMCYGKFIYSYIGEDSSLSKFVVAASSFTTADLLAYTICGQVIHKENLLDPGIQIAAETFATMITGFAIYCAAKSNAYQLIDWEESHTGAALIGAKFVAEMGSGLAAWFVNGFVSKGTRYYCLYNNDYAELFQALRPKQALDRWHELGQVMLDFTRSFAWKEAVRELLIIGSQCDVATSPVLFPAVMFASDWVHQAWYYLASTPAPFEKQHTLADDETSELNKPSPRKGHHAKKDSNKLDNRDDSPVRSQVREIAQIPEHERLVVSDIHDNNRALLLYATGRLSPSGDVHQSSELSETHETIGPPNADQTTAAVEGHDTNPESKPRVSTCGKITKILKAAASELIPSLPSITAFVLINTLADQASTPEDMDTNTNNLSSLRWRMLMDCCRYSVVRAGTEVTRICIKKSIGLYTLFTAPSPTKVKENSELKEPLIPKNQVPQVLPYVSPSPLNREEPRP